MFRTEMHVLLRQTIFNTFFGKCDSRITSAKFCLIQVSLYCLSLYFLLHDLCSIVLRELNCFSPQNGRPFNFLDVIMITAAARRIKTNQFQKAVQILT